MSADCYCQLEDIVLLFQILSNLSALHSPVVISYGVHYLHWLVLSIHYSVERNNCTFAGQVKSEVR